MFQDHWMQMHHFRCDPLNLFVYPPTVAAWFSIFAVWSYPVARHVWNWFTFLCFVGAVLWTGFLATAQ
ncbi:hypothetical protein BXT84_12685 [Sulfobacillus thermotolerans]|uniref:Uncharacterized protein n=1 Tax=Sulfobacillus thermotolerans TaxID=338644 RepID=A0ABM6RTM9_9FIRM|nr:hypothetical protein BXT84_12685 [Sulfobacillus thermotolerans]